MVLLGMLPMTVFATTGTDGIQYITVNASTDTEAIMPTVYQADEDGNATAVTGVDKTHEKYAVAVPGESCSITITAANAYVKLSADSGEISETFAPDQGTTYASLTLVKAQNAKSKVTVQVSKTADLTAPTTYYLWITWNATDSAPESDSPYSVALSPLNASATVGETVALAVYVSGSDIATYNAYDIQLTYDPALLAYQSVTGTDENTYVDAATAGTVHIVGYGAAKAFTTPAATVKFTAKQVGNTAVELTAAKVSNSAQVEENAAPATITAKQSTITVSNYTVRLSTDFTGAETAVPGAEYTFTALDPYYTYTFTATMDGQPVTVQDQGNGEFAIANVSGNLIIDAEKTPMEYDVALKLYSNTGELIDNHGDVTYETKALHDTDYTFIVHKESAHCYTVAATIGQVEYNGLVSSGETYTIAGADITAPITLTVTKALNTTDNAKLRFEGTGAGDVTIQSVHYQTGDEIQVAPGQDIKFTLTGAAKYDYAVTLGQTVLTPDENGVYTISAAHLSVGTSVVITVERSLRVTVKVSTYLTLADGTTLYCIATTYQPAPGTSLAYQGQPMYRKGDRYLILIKATAKPTAEQAASLVTETDAAAQTLSTGHDVNGTGRVDINDVQIVYDMYMKTYDYTATTALHFLRADVNNDGVIGIDDCVAIVSSILGQSDGVTP